MCLSLALFTITILFQTSEPFIYPSMLSGLNWPSSLFGGSYGLRGSSGLPWSDDYHGTLRGSSWNELSGNLVGQTSSGGLFTGLNALLPGGQFSNGLFPGAYGQPPLGGQLGGGLFPNGLLQPNAGGVCPPGWTLYAARGKCFIAISSGAMRGWMDHSQACQALMPTATLASIHDANEQNFVADVARTKGTQDAWIGMWDQLGSGLWRWVDNSPVEYAFWELGQPDKYLGIQHCVRMQLNKYGAWDDLNCDNSAIWTSVCQVYTQNTQPIQG